MASNCYPCIMDRAKFECDLVFSKEEEKKAAVEELLDYIVAKRAECRRWWGNRAGEHHQKAQRKS